MGYDTFCMNTIFTVKLPRAGSEITYCSVQQPQILSILNSLLNFNLLNIKPLKKDVFICTYML